MNAETLPEPDIFARATPFETACAWVQWSAQHPGDEAARERCMAWRAERIEHEEAYQRANRTWKALGEIEGNPVLAAWRETARQTRVSRRPWFLAASFVGLVLIACAVWVSQRPEVPLTAMMPPLRETLQPASGSSEEYRVANTGLGERQLMVLKDGTRITLNTSSRLEVDYRGDSRRVRLISGEAMFRVAKNPHRPFVVTVGHREIVALGTAFGVRLQGAAVKVTLVEGRVAVASTQIEPDHVAQDPDTIVLKPGQQLRESDAEAPAVQSVDAERALSWQNGWLIFDNEPLPSAIAEVSRYTHERIEYDDPRMAALKISGAIRTGQVDDLADALARVYPIEVERGTSDIIRLVWRP